MGGPWDGTNTELNVPFSTAEAIAVIFVPVRWEAELFPHFAILEGTSLTGWAGELFSPFPASESKTAFQAELVPPFTVLGSVTVGGITVSGEMVTPFSTAHLATAISGEDISLPFTKMEGVFHQTTDFSGELTSPFIQFSASLLNDLVFSLEVNTPFPFMFAGKYQGNVFSGNLESPIPLLKGAWVIGKVFQALFTTPFTTFEGYSKAVVNGSLSAYAPFCQLSGSFYETDKLDSEILHFEESANATWV